MIKYQSNINFFIRVKMRAYRLNMAIYLPAVVLFTTGSVFAKTALQNHNHSGEYCRRCKKQVQSITIMGNKQKTTLN